MGCEVQLVVDAAFSRPARWALDQLRQAHLIKGKRIEERTTPESGPAILVGLAERSPAVDHALAVAGRPCPSAPESLVIHQLSRERLIVAGRDERGLVYALTEVARAVERSPTEDHLFDAVVPAVESPELAWRSLQLFLCNRALERKWFYREGFWEDYLTQLAYCRFNNLSLTFGHQTSYLSPPYPFLVEMPEFPHVRPIGFTPEERRAHLDMLKSISEMARERGIHFTFAVWSQHAPHISACFLLTDGCFRTYILLIAIHSTSFRRPRFSCGRECGHLARGQRLPEDPSTLHKMGLRQACFPSSRSKSSFDAAQNDFSLITTGPRGSPHDEHIDGPTP
jgi:hypothetical protein